jgi:HTH-type transcriptional regulator/antitoxin HigA
MTKNVAKKTVHVESDVAVHPGELLAEELAARAMTQRALAEAMGRPPQVINEIVRGRKAITAETAIQLERALGTPAHMWLQLQMQYELAVARGG